jgi:hypothetical protein
MDKFPEWRAFSRNSDEEIIEAKDKERIIEVAENFVKEFATNEAVEFIQPEIPDALEQLAGQVNLSPKDIRVANNDSHHSVDILESLNNIFKRLSEGAMWVISNLGKFAKYSANHLIDGAKEEWEKQLKGLGKSFVKWTVRLFKIGVAGAVGAGITGVSLPWLIATFPAKFGWLSAFFQVLKPFFS